MLGKALTAVLAPSLSQPIDDAVDDAVDDREVEAIQLTDKYP